MRNESNAWPDVSGQMVPWGPSNPARATKLGDTETVDGGERYVTVNGHKLLPANGTKVKNRSEKVRRIYVRDGRRCWWCGKLLMPIDEVETHAVAAGLGEARLPANFPTIDHLIPKSRGGSNRLDNLVVACETCNHERGDAMPRQTPIPNRTVVQSVTCPDCTDGVWEKADGRLCPTCDGVGELSAERAVELFTAARKKIRNLFTGLMRTRSKVHALERIIEEELGPHSARRDLAKLAQNRRDIIRTLSDRILTLKVELAAATGADLARLIPFEHQRRRALALSTKPPLVPSETQDTHQ